MNLTDFTIDIIQSLLKVDVVQSLRSLAPKLGFTSCRTSKVSGSSRLFTAQMMNLANSDGILVLGRFCAKCLLDTSRDLVSRC